MRRVVVLFVGILSVVRATPFDLDSFDRSNPIRDNFRVQYEDDNKIGIFESGKNYIDESDNIGSTQGLVDLFGHIKDCKLMDLKNPPKEGCAYVYKGSLYLLHVLSEVNIEDVYKAFKDAGIKECVVGTPFSELLKDHCYLIDEINESVLWFGIYNVDIVGKQDIVDRMGKVDDIMRNIDKCNVTDTEIPEEGCALFDEEGVHIINVLTEDNIDDIPRELSEVGFGECIFDEDHDLITIGPCYKIDQVINGFHLFNLPGGPEGTQDDDDDDDDYDHSEKTYNIPDEVISRPSFVQTATGYGHLQIMKLKGLFNQQSSVAKKAKDFFSKKIQSRKQPRDVQKELGRWGHQHGRQGNNGDRVPKWMKYLQTNA